MIRLNGASSTRGLILILATSGFASTFSGRAVEPMIGLIARDLATSAETIALLSAAFALPYAFIQPILGPVGDALGKERIMKMCLAVLVVALIGSMIAPNAMVLFSMRILAGLAAGGVVPLAIALVGDQVDMAQRQIAISRFLVAIITGQLAGSSLAGLLAEQVGWRGVFAVSTALMVVAFAATLGGLKGGSAGGRVDVALVALRYRDILANPRARALFLFVFAEGMAVFGVFPYIAPLLEASGQGGPTEAGIALGGFAIGGLAYSALVGWMLARLGLGRMLIAGGMFGAAALLTIGLAGDWRVGAAAMVVLGLGFYMLHNSFQTQVTEVAPQARGSAVALHAFSYFSGQALGVVAIGAGLRTVGLFPSMTLAAVVILGVGLVAAATLTLSADQPRGR
jgi:predicted MFS family arabinose efflux permease